jgi:hypothetical protein
MIAWAGWVITQHDEHPDKFESCKKALAGRKPIDQSSPGLHPTGLECKLSEGERNETLLVAVHAGPGSTLDAGGGNTLHKGTL